MLSRKLFGSVLVLFSSFFLVVVLALTSFGNPLFAQNPDQLQVGPPPIHRAEPPAPGASAEELEKRGDELRANKSYLDAVDYYEVVIRKAGGSANLLNKIGICQLQMRRYNEAKKTLERAVKKDPAAADALNNLGVVYYELGVEHHSSRDFGRAIKMYDRAIAVNDDASSYYNNRGAAHFARKDYEKGARDYGMALQLDPDIFERTSRGGVQAMLPSPEDRARYEYVVAKIYAKAGENERSLHFLRKAMEDGYKDIANVYKDNEFSALRKDPRFTELMAAKPPSVPE
jgi:tetratricopeptide (TPR) repeat protein